MSKTTSHRLESKITQIMNAWEKRALAEIKAAQHQESLALRNSLPIYLTQMADALSQTIDRTQARVRQDKHESTRIGKKHGGERATSIHYTMDQMIAEYHILRQVIFDIMEEEKPFTAVEREVIICSIEQAVNDAATQFSDSLKEFNQHLAHTLVHDLRNPLSVVKGSAQLVLRFLDDRTGTEKRTKLIVKNVDRIDSMIAQLLDVGRQDAWEESISEYSETDLDAVLKDVIEGFSVSNGPRFHYDSPKKSLGTWNEKSLIRLIENLTANAVKYGKENSTITFKLGQTEDEAILTIHNEGTPIPPEEQDLLFDKYRRSKNTDGKVGWGLGLTVAKDMVESHKGTITVESSHEKGTTFKVVLPNSVPSKP